MAKTIRTLAFEIKKVGEIKELGDAGAFEGMLSPYGNVDQGGDVVEAGAYAKTLQDGGITRPLLYQHREPIGELTLEDRKDGLWAKGQILMTLSHAPDVHQLIKNRIVKGLSIGFESVRDAIEGGVRHLKEIKLYEGSIVTFPMNTSALIESVKARFIDIDDELKSGARFSADTKSAIQSIANQFKSAHEALLALITDDAGVPTSPEKAAAVQTALAEIQAALRRN